MLKLPKRPLEPLFWFAYKAPKRIFKIIKRLIILVNHSISFTLNIKLLFVPLFGDYTIPGRIIGFIFRIAQIFYGLLALLVLALLLILAPLFWYISPFVLAYYIKGYILLLAFGIYVVRLFAIRDTPRKRVTDDKTEDPLSAVRPNALSLLKQAHRTHSLEKFAHDADIHYLLQKLELDKKDFYAQATDLPDFEVWKVAKSAYELAQEEGTRYVEKEHVFYALLKLIPDVENFLMSFGVALADVKEAIFWIVDERDRLAGIFIWQEDYHIDKLGGFGRGMTGRVTPSLDAVSTDFTELAKKGLIEGIIAHHAEIKEIANLLSGSKKVNVMIVGPPGSGKTSIVKGIAEQIIKGTEYEKIANKRIVSVESGALVAGAKSSGDVAAKFKLVMKDALESGDIILFFDEIHNLVSGVGGDATEVSSVYSILEPYLSTGQIQVIAATNRKTYRKYIEPNGAFARLFHVVDIEPSTNEETKDILKYLSFDIEEEEGVLITLPAIKKIIRLSSKLIQERVFPDKAVDVLNRCVRVVSRESKVVTAEKAAEVISEMTHVPVTAVDEDESEKLLELEDRMKERVIGQDQAVAEVSKALKRARVGIRDESKPIASFLFVGTTGVGKTETAKTLSRLYFGEESKMIRLDMSEYQQPDSVKKLIGNSDGSTSGILTEVVRSNPFSVLLLDEIEKAAPQVLLTFLQVLDDGRLTDSAGNTVDFANTIIIATSNVGTREIQAVAARDGSFSEMEEAALKKVRDHYAPEFLNRFSGIIVFNPLSKEDVKKIARILLRKVEKVAAEKDIKVTFTDGLLEGLVERGYNKEWGARPLARVIEDKVETYLADKLLSKEIKRGDVLELGPEVFE
ncbi:AAA domain-containing protein [candidate division WWE3 bacterium]|nr:AAA domain-containing protein [candidate division WWE3 bacterium]